MNTSELGSSWLCARPHLRRLAAKLQGLLELADDMWQRGRATGESVDYEAFEQTVAQKTAEVERAVHEATLSSLDIDAPFVRVWGKTYRRLHRTLRSYRTMAGSVPVTRTLYRALGTRSGAALDPIAQRAGMVDGSWLPRTARVMAHLWRQRRLCFVLA